MAMVTHTHGDMLAQTRVKAKANFEEVITLHAEIEAVDMTLPGSGMGLVQLRQVCQANFDEMLDPVNGILPTPTGLEVIGDGDMLWELRRKLNVNFALIAVA